MDYDNVDAKLSFHAKILNGQDTRPFHSSKQPGVPRLWSLAIRVSHSAKMVYVSSVRATEFKTVN